jgi:hypothetical protein
MLRNLFFKFVRKVDGKIEEKLVYFEFSFEYVENLEHVIN